MMKLPRMDRLVYQELIGPYIFGVAMFTVLILAATYLFRLTGFLVAGVPILTIVELFALFTPGILVKTFAMAMLLAGLLAFGRLSNDAEIIALRAAGANMARIMRPVAIFSLVVAGVAFGVDETLVPWAAQKSEALGVAIATKLDPSKMTPTSEPIVQNGKVLGMVVARNLNTTTDTLLGATVLIYNPDGTNAWVLWAKELKFNPALASSTGGGWRIVGGATLQSGDGSTFTRINDRAWPPDIPHPNFSIQDLLADQLNNLDVLSMKGIQTEIARLKKDKTASKSQIANLQYGYWNKIALPFAAFIYGILGAPLGIRNSRSSTAGGFALAVAIIFGYVTIANLLSVYAQGGLLPAWAASFAPLVVGIAASAWIIRSRNI